MFYGNCGIHMESITIPSGMVVESMWNPLSFHGSIWNGGGIHTNIPSGFQMDIPYGMMEYTWNP
jgi:hypothetical protein